MTDKKKGFAANLFQRIAEVAHKRMAEVAQMNDEAERGQLHGNTLSEHFELIQAVKDDNAAYKDTAQGLDRLEAEENFAKRYAASKTGRNSRSGEVRFAQLEAEAIQEHYTL